MALIVGSVDTALFQYLSYTNQNAWLIVLGFVVSEIFLYFASQKHKESKENEHRISAEIK